LINAADRATGVVTFDPLGDGNMVSTPYMNRKDDDDESESEGSLEDPELMSSSSNNNNNNHLEDSAVGLDASERSTTKKGRRLTKILKFPWKGGKKEGGDAASKAGDGDDDTHAE